MYHFLKLEKLSLEHALEKAGCGDAAKQFKDIYGHMITPDLMRAFVEESLLEISSKRDENKTSQEKQKDEVIAEKLEEHRKMSQASDQSENIEDPTFTLLLQRLMGIVSPYNDEVNSSGETNAKMQVCIDSEQKLSNLYHCIKSLSRFKKLWK